MAYHSHIPAMLARATTEGREARFTNVVRVVTRRATADHPGKDEEEFPRWTIDRNTWENMWKYEPFPRMAENPEERTALTRNSAVSAAGNISGGAAERGTSLGGTADQATGTDFSSRSVSDVTKVNNSNSGEGKVGNTSARFIIAALTARENGIAGPSSTAPATSGSTTHRLAAVRSQLRDVLGQIAEREAKPGSDIDAELDALREQRDLLQRSQVLLQRIENARAEMVLDEEDITQRVHVPM
ncbi:uncharacterized protein LY89DRAFT_749458 [Mollisia scopiformis]|uniref:Uncharacterized protein n=1 Tax=Mollisia scopiformis TaxID=149040 RepID=A0A194X937_MOLSC|nr:uncharacterized protein LY89DRAFT_749458 [Mollisia scopiformis]KUJ16624.1 hypothetical protein LY89DRAFT_749458 [Mollisia scopiformis]